MEWETKRRKYVEKNKNFWDKGGDERKKKHTQTQTVINTENIRYVCGDTLFAHQ